MAIKIVCVCRLWQINA